VTWCKEQHLSNLAYCSGLLRLHPTLQTYDHPFSAVRYYVFKIERCGRVVNNPVTYMGGSGSNLGQETDYPD
jgi:hypothetical protein